MHTDNKVWSCALSCPHTSPAQPLPHVPRVQCPLTWSPGLSPRGTATSAWTDMSPGGPVPVCSRPKPSPSCGRGAPPESPWAFLLSGEWEIRPPQPQLHLPCPPVGSACQWGCEGLHRGLNRHLHERNSAGVPGRGPRSTRRCRPDPGSSQWLTLLAGHQQEGENQALQTHPLEEHREIQC